MLTGPLIALAVVACGLLAAAILPRLDRWQATMVGLLLASMLTAGSISALVGPASIGRILLAGALLLVVMLTPRHGQERPTARAVLILLWACVAVGGTSVLWSVNPTNTASYAITFAILVGVLQGTVNRRWIDRGVISRDFTIMFAVMAVFVAGGAIAALAGFDFAVGFADRARGFFQNANKLGNVAALTAVVGWALAFQSGRKWYLVATVPVVYAVIASGSRTALIALAIAGLWFLLQARFVTKFVALWAAATGACTWLLLRSFGVIEATDLSEGAFARFAQPDEGAPLNGRLGVWDIARGVTSDYWAGVGFGATPDYLTQVNPLAINLELNSVHNSYLQWFMETGLVGALPMVALIAVTVWLILSPRTRLGAGMAAVALAGLVMQVTESMIFGVGQVHPWVYWLAVLAIAVSRDLGTTRDAVDAPAEAVAQVR